MGPKLVAVKLTTFGGDNMVGWVGDRAYQI